ncbi:hypothetical protein BVER_02369 [Candidatus Burkholderia verschuerenii]|uniref:Uncharacterized protein n=2 Tax=Candidatus Burkholderia verschuerenii TaxID=242163 RepID=A0A0L0M5L4_9BURK|nr:hypothetical protein BVER_02369 [Candidatus Burkholderia verschuerenii]
MLKSPPFMPFSFMAEQSKTKRGLARRARNNKALFLPVSVATANQISLRSWTALDRVRAGDADSAAVIALAHATVVAARVSQAGFGDIDKETLDEVAAGLSQAIGRGCESGDWQLAPALLAPIGRVLDEHHRQLRQVRMAVIVEANEWLETRLEQGARFEDLLGDATSAAKQAGGE